MQLIPDLKISDIVIILHRVRTLYTCRSAGLGFVTPRQEESLGAPKVLNEPWRRRGLSHCIGQIIGLWLDGCVCGLWFILMRDVLFPEISWLSWIGPCVGQAGQSLLIPTCQLFEELYNILFV